MSSSSAAPKPVPALTVRAVGEGRAVRLLLDGISTAVRDPQALYVASVSTLNTAGGLVSIATGARVGPTLRGTAAGRPLAQFVAALDGMAYAALRLVPGAREAPDVLRATAGTAARRIVVNLVPAADNTADVTVVAWDSRTGDAGAGARLVDAALASPLDQEEDAMLFAGVRRTAPILVVDVAPLEEGVGGSAEAVVSDLRQQVLRRQAARCGDGGPLRPQPYFVGVLPTARRDVAPDGTESRLVDAAAWVLPAVEAIEAPRHLVWDPLPPGGSINPRFIPHLRRVFWQLDRDGDWRLSASELQRAYEIMNGLSTDEDLRAVRAILAPHDEEEEEETQQRDANDQVEGRAADDPSDTTNGGDDDATKAAKLKVNEKEHPKEQHDEEEEDIEEEEEPALVVTGDGLADFTISFGGFVRVIHALLRPDHGHRAVWYLLRRFNHSPVDGNVYTAEDAAAVLKAKHRAAREVIEALGEDPDVVLGAATATASNSNASTTLGKCTRPSTTAGGPLPVNAVVVGSLSKVGAAFFASLFPSAPTVAHCRPPAFPSLADLWAVVPCDLPVPWEGVRGLPQVGPWLAREGPLLHRKQGSRSYATYARRSLENVFRFLECWQWAAAGGGLGNTSRIDACAVAVVRFARLWGFRGGAETLITYRGCREWREGHPAADGALPAVHTLLVGAPGSGRSSLLRVATYDGGDHAPFLAEDDEHDIPADDDDAEYDFGEEDAGSEGVAETLKAKTMTVRPVTIFLPPGSHHGPPSSSATTSSSNTAVVFFYQMANGPQQDTLFERGAAVSTSGSSTSVTEAVAMPVAMQGLPPVDPCSALLLARADACLFAFDGSDGRSLPFLSLLFGGAQLGRLAYWTKTRRLPVVLLHTKADLPPQPQCLNLPAAAQAAFERECSALGAVLQQLSQALGAEEVAAARSLAAVGALCAHFGLPRPVLVSAEAEELWIPTERNAVAALAQLVHGTATSAAAIVGPRVTRPQREATAKVEQAAVYTRRVLIVLAAVAAVATCWSLLRSKSSSSSSSSQSNGSRPSTTTTTTNTVTSAAQSAGS